MKEHIVRLTAAQGNFIHQHQTAAMVAVEIFQILGALWLSRRNVDDWSNTFRVFGRSVVYVVLCVAVTYLVYKQF